ncbi:hypothetical protein CH373_02425 [Leptospira perolatii]|uniref:Uncharacterized protein n=1 Tax=Leptospira perolatii TaxID=2023191 RepID=A0A2M9ZS38_9LEPT|nr:hypothetical protein [Leptospira perolatii]PJZ71374.1 hypothetical protein CH360_02425 [Leptospira perolatii]PJZ74908.1 hypothetical protein CH373_02425 [Leptospira perolatii]
MNQILDELQTTQSCEIDKSPLVYRAVEAFALTDQISSRPEPDSKEFYLESILEKDLSQSYVGCVFLPFAFA